MKLIPKNKPLSALEEIVKLRIMIDSFKKEMEKHLKELHTQYTIVLEAIQQNVGDK